MHPTNSHRNATPRYSGREEQQYRNDSSQPASQPIPVFHVRHEPLLSIPPWSRQQPGFNHFNSAQNLHSQYHPPYLPGIPTPYWTPPMPQHQYQQAPRGPYRENCQHPLPSTNPKSSQPALNSPLNNISQNNILDMPWPDLNETNKTPTKATLRGQHRPSLSPAQKADRKILSSSEDNLREVLSVRKDAIARLTAARNEGLSPARATEARDPEYESLHRALNLRSPSRDTTAPGTEPKTDKDNEFHPEIAPSLSLSRTSTISAGLEGSPMPSLTSLLSFSDGVWGHEDIPMLRSRLCEMSQQCNKDDLEKRGRIRRLSSPLDFGLHDELPYTPLLDQLDLFASSPNDCDNLGSGLQLTAPHEDTGDNYDGDTTLLNEEWKRVKDSALYERMRDVIKAEIATMRRDFLEEALSTEAIGNEHDAHVREILTNTLDYLRQGKSVKGWEDSGGSSKKEAEILGKDLTLSVQPILFSPAPCTLAVGPTRNMPLLTDSRSHSAVSPIAEVSQPNRSGTTFASILLDGDSTLFHPDLIKKGSIGGQQAAFALSTAVYHLCLERSDSHTVPNCFTVQVFFNEQAIAARLVETGVIDSAKVLAEFSAGFTDSHGLFTFVNVSTRQTAANKIKEHLRLFANLDACRLILLGTNQGYEYKELLSDFNAVGQGSKIYAARSTSPDGIDPLDKVLGLRLQTIPGLFRTAVASEGPDLTQTIEHDEQDDRTVNDSERGSAAGSIEFTKAASGIADHTVQLVPASVASDDEFIPVLSRKKKPALTTKMSYASSAMSTKNVSFVRTSGTDAKKRKKGRSLASTQHTNLGLDYDHADYLSVKRYQPRPCHRFYLTNGCKNGLKCHYGHDYELTKGEINALKSLSKEMLCPAYAIGTCKGTNETCIYGHECPRNQDCTFGSECWFTSVQGLHGKEARA